MVLKIQKKVRLILINQMNYLSQHLALSKSVGIKQIAFFIWHLLLSNLLNKQKGFFDVKLSQTLIMKKFFKISGIVLGVIVAVGFLTYLIYNEPLPTGEKGPKADQLADKMLAAINHEAYKSTRFIEWSMVGRHFYKWDKQLHRVEIKWKDNQVVLYPNTPERNELIAPKDLSDKQKNKLFKTATNYFNNDSFWLVAPHKVYDPGVERQLVKHNNQDALLVTYTSGGSTPGDSYLWILDETGKPLSFKMWVSIIPVGGVEATWENWITMESGLPLAKIHEIFSFKIDMGELKGYNNSAIDVEVDMTKEES